MGLNILKVNCTCTFKTVKLSIITLPPLFSVVCKIRNPSYSAVVERSLHATRNFWAIISKDINYIEISLNISSFLSFFAESSDMTTRS